MRPSRLAFVRAGFACVLAAKLTLLAGCESKPTPTVSPSNPLGETDEMKAQRQATEEFFKKDAKKKH